MPFRGRVHLLLELPLVDRADGVLGPAEDLRSGPRRLLERELCDRVADPPLDPLGAERCLVVAAALAPLLRAIRVSDGHADDRDRRVDAAEGNDAWNAASGADDHAASDLFAENAVRRADVAGSLRGDRRRLQAKAALADRGGGVVDDGVLRRAPRLERQVEPRKLERESDDVGRENPQ